MAASANGRESIVRFLLENYGNHLQIDKERIIFAEDAFDHSDYFYCKQTALCLATEYKHLDIVRTLVSLGKPNVNHRAILEWQIKCTPLYLACKNEQLEMVKYLIENGSDIYNVDTNESTALMIACKYKHDELVEYLLSLDDATHTLVNAVDKCGSTALHVAASVGSLNIVRLLLEKYQAKIVKNNEAQTAFTMAGISNHIDIVKYFIENENECWYTILRCIDELELIGSLTSKYEYFLWAMQLRYKNTAAPILKNNLATPIKAYEYYEECETVEELEAIKNDSHRFRLECFMIRERLAGVTSGLLNSLDRYACKYVTDYKHALQIYSHACYLRLSAQIDLDKLTLSLEKCTGVMYQLAECNMVEVIPFSIFTSIFEGAIVEFIRYKKLMVANLGKIRYSHTRMLYFDCDVHLQYDSNEQVNIIFELLFIATKILAASEKADQRRKAIYQLVNRIIYADCSAEQKKSHIIAQVFIFKLLLECGAPINAMDSFGNTPLHILAIKGCEYNDIETIFELLLGVGAHLDAINAKGTPEQYANNDKIQSLFRAHSIQLSLKCLCARIIRQSHINYNDSLQKHLHSFVELH
ncbi:unnamed protein product [Rotaria socialis]|uniref:Uncharacterized protein n=1 Tax=Rotaria socialis TaxID=392032 RepID=A0A821MWR7_9BILA|nr:unnamed protein product [Rotaria socialis]